MIINRVWCMSNKKTFSIKPIKEFVEKYIDLYPGIVIDPFANESKYDTLCTTEIKRK